MEEWEFDKDMLQSVLLYKRINKKEESIEKVTVLNWQVQLREGYEVFVCQVQFNDLLKTIKRRFSHFDLLHQYLDSA